jgi:RHS repeat-associated protein
MGHATEGRQFYLFDGLGSVSDLMRPDGAIQAAYKYDAWGESRGGIGASSNPFGFTGHERDETGLYYFKARFYDPDIGRFLSEDPADGDFKNPPSLHKYLYAYGNPTVYIDPDGRIAVVDNAVGGVLSVGIGFAATCFFRGCDQYSLTDAAVDFGLGFASSGLSSLKYLKYAKEAGALANTARVGGRVGAQYAVGFAGEVARHELKGEEYTLGEVSTEAITGALIGEAGDVAAKGVRAAGKAAAETLAQSESKVGKFLARDLEDLVPSTNRTPSKETVITGESASRPGVGVVADDAAESGAARSASDAATPSHIQGEAPPTGAGPATLEGAPSSAAERAKEIHAAVGEGTQRRTTISVTETAEGVRVVSSSERRLRPAQRRMLREGEIEGVGPGHAEPTGVSAAEGAGLTPTGTAASRPICAKCAVQLEKRGIEPLSPLKKRRER